MLHNIFLSKLNFFSPLVFIFLHFLHHSSSEFTVCSSLPFFSTSSLMSTFFSHSPNPWWYFCSSFYISSPESSWVGMSPLDPIPFSLFGEVVVKDSQLSLFTCTCVHMCTRVSPFRYDWYERLVVEMKCFDFDFCLSDSHEEPFPNVDAPQNCLQSTGSQGTNHQEFPLLCFRFKLCPFP